MNSSTTPTSTTKEQDEFQFPFEPYDVQVQLMRALYDTFENRQIGVFESPTGTVT
jgi:chromosome transmission fidelity protein 1